MTKVKLIGLCLSISLIGMPTNASACRMSHLLNDQIKSRASVVFEGKVLSIEPQIMPMEFCDGSKGVGYTRSLITFEVEQISKGELPDGSVEVISWKSSTVCGQKRLEGLDDYFGKTFVIGLKSKTAPDLPYMIVNEGCGQAYMFVRPKAQIEIQAGKP